MKEPELFLFCFKGHHCQFIGAFQKDTVTNIELNVVSAPSCVILEADHCPYNMY